MPFCLSFVFPLGKDIQSVFENVKRFLMPQILHFFRQVVRRNWFRFWGQVYIKVYCDSVKYRGF